MGQSPGEMWVLATVLSLLASVAVVLRICARRIKKQRLQWDDFLIIIALLFTLGTGVCMFVGTAIGDLGRHTKVDPTGYPIVTPATLVFFKVSYASLMTTTLTFGLTKLSVLLFYKRIFCGPVINAAIYTMLTVVGAWTVAFFFSNMLQCMPLSVNWTGVGGNAEQCINENMMYLAQAFSDVITDVMILSLPIPCIWALQMSVTRRIAICGIFLLGALTVAASVTRLIVTYKIEEATLTGDMDITYLLTPILYWPMVESSLGIVGACLPSMRPIFTEPWGGKFVSSVREIMTRRGSKGLESDLEGNGSGESVQKVVPQVKVRKFSEDEYCPA